MSQKYPSKHLKQTPRRVVFFCNIVFGKNGPKSDKKTVRTRFFIFWAPKTGVVTSIFFVSVLGGSCNEKSRRILFLVGYIHIVTVRELPIRRRVLIREINDYTIHTHAYGTCRAVRTLPNSSVHDRKLRFFDSEREGEKEKGRFSRLIGKQPILFLFSFFKTILHNETSNATTISHQRNDKALFLLCSFPLPPPL